MRGTIIRKRSEGYGFIKPDDGGKDVFFHATSVVDVTFDELQEGDTVSFDIEQGDKGPAATNVTRVAGGANMAEAA
jgi:CspA family cold shock protein